MPRAGTGSRTQLGSVYIAERDFRRAQPTATEDQVP